LSKIDQLDALQRSRAGMNLSGGSDATIEMGRFIGEGYKQGGNGCLTATDSGFFFLFYWSGGVRLEIRLSQH
jgi:hypothetical protein